MTPRTRGAKGREEAALRGLVDGTGPDGGITERGMNVVMYGLPGRLHAHELKDFVLGYQLREAGIGSIVKVGQP
jgi:hypothetical protein